MIQRICAMKMDSMRVQTSRRFITLFVFVLTYTFAVTEQTKYDVGNSPLTQNIKRGDIVLLQNDRVRRDTAMTSTTTSNSSNLSSLTPNDSTTISTSLPTPTAAPENGTHDSNKTALIVNANHTSLLGFNGTGILHVTIPSNTPTVSEPITPGDDTADVFKDTLETIKAKNNLTDIQLDHHVFYNSTFLGNTEFFNEYWSNITKQKADVHEVLSNSHRRATTINLSFDFMFYGNPVKNITVATGGFIFIGDHVHNWLAATQYIAPLMANFDTTLGNDSVVKQYDDGEKFVVFWENVTLQENSSDPFTFAVVLYKSGDIAFVYKDVPFPIQNISDKEHPVKVGISDAYLTGQTYLHVKHKTIYEYHRISFKNYEISNHTILMLIALPTCLVYDTCEDCANHETHFNCSWCPNINKCSSGIDKIKHDWAMHHCEAVAIKDEKTCPARVSHTSDTKNTIYTTDNRSDEQQEARKLHTEGTPDVPVPKQHSTIGGVVVSLVIVISLCSFAGWVLYAFKNPHTRSGQILIRYRPSQWSWRRGEARYTAATIHM
ncbi:plexin domain-containing protein 2 [Pieris napi]|uniref:plexin domain-containing protein 2 n=1 Tax=Pieris napi TaxID=78633 RepID=UPI001FBA91B1|nr:plexin domain-containing protein 2 [Pieris napi]